MSEQASGSFAVQLTPETSAGDAVGRFSITKRFHGDLDASSTGSMLSVHGEVKGSAGYVAMERVTGTLGDRTGSFALQHGGTMDRGRPTLGVTIVPDSGTADLAGISGDMSIDVTDGRHAYVLRYSLPR